jgi:hypothetical protein
MPYDASGIVPIQLALCPALKSCHVVLDIDILILGGGEDLVNNNPFLTYIFRL